MYVSVLYSHLTTYSKVSPTIEACTVDRENFIGKIFSQSRPTAKIMTHGVQIVQHSTKEHGGTTAAPTLI